MTGREGERGDEKHEEGERNGSRGEGENGKEEKSGRDRSGRVIGRQWSKSK